MQQSYLPYVSQVAININHGKIEKIVTKFSIIVGLIFFLLVIAIFIFSSFILVSWMKYSSYLPPLSQISVTGELNYTTNKDILQAMISLNAPGTFITQNIKIIQQQIEFLPWIKQVSVRKKWPDALKIHLKEYIPVALWNDLYLLDCQGKIFSAPVERIENHHMPMLYGPEGSEQEVLFCYSNLENILTSAKFQIKSVSMSARHSLQLILRDKLRLELGRNDKLKRLQRFIGIYPVLIQQAQNANKRIIYVDLRYDMGLAVGWSSKISRTIK